MGIKLLIAQACLIAGDEVGRHADVGETVEVATKEEALLLTRAHGRAFYLDKADDPTKGTLTASPEDKDRIKREVKQLAAVAEQRAAEAQMQSPGGMAAMVAAAVASAVQAALQKPVEPAKA